MHLLGVLGMLCTAHFVSCLASAELTLCNLRRSAMNSIVVFQVDAMLLPVTCVGPCTTCAVGDDTYIATFACDHQCTCIKSCKLQIVAISANGDCTIVHKTPALGPAPSESSSSLAQEDDIQGCCGLQAIASVIWPQG